MDEQSGFDACECIYGHEGAMRRLVNLLRQSQSYCTDNHCPQTLPGPEDNVLTTPSNVGLWVILGLWLLLMTVMFIAGYRPGRNRNAEKPDRHNQDRSGQDPPSIA